MASNLETFSSPECVNPNFHPPKHTSSPKSADFAANTLLTLNELNKDEVKPSTMSSSTCGSVLNQTSKRDSGGSSRTSPSKPKYNLLTKKTTKSSLQNKNPDEVYNELIELKKVNSNLGDENTALKNKLRKSEEEQSKKNEMERTSNNMLVSNLKRKIQLLEESIKEKDNNIKKLQAEARMAKHEAKIALDRQDSIAKKGTTGLKENLKLQKTPMTNSRSPGSRSAEARSPTKSLLLVDENKQLREKLHKALAIHDPNVIENYKDLSSEELIAQIQHLKAEVEVLQKIKTKIEEDNQNGIVDIEVEKLNSEIHHLKIDRLTYFEESEKKDLEIKNLKDELEQIRKDVGKNRPMYGAIPKVPSQLSHSVESKNKPRLKLDMLKKSSSVTSSSFESTAKRTITTSKPKTATAATSKSSATLAASTLNGAAAKSKQKVVKEGLSPIRNGHSPINVAKTKNASPKQSPKERIEVVKFRQNVAAKKIQQSWKSHRSDVTENGNRIIDKPVDGKEIGNNRIEDKSVDSEGNCNGVDNKLIDFEGNGHHNNDEEEELNSLQEAVTTIQSVARGNEVRSDLLSGDISIESTVETNEDMKRSDKDVDENEKDVDENVTTIQSVARAHHHREEILKTWETNGDAIVVSAAVDVAAAAATNN